MKTKLLLLIFLFSLQPSFAVFGSTLDDQRVFGVAVSEGVDGFVPAFNKAKELGIETTILGVNWDELEKSPGQYSNLNLAGINDFFYGQKVSLFVTLSSIDTNNLRVPNDLKGKDFNDPQVVQRFKDAVDHVMSQLKDVAIAGFGVGNEIDVYLVQDEQWRQYTDFYCQIADHIHKWYPGMKVGSKATMDGLIKLQSRQLQNLNEYSDIIMVTYYNLGQNFKANPPKDVHDHFKQLVDLYPDKPIAFLEAGYPASTVLNSSEEKQVEFFQELFKAWDHYAKNVKHVVIFLLHDYSDEALQNYVKYYGVGGREFSEYLGTIGLVAHSGKEKKSFQVIKDMVSKGERGEKEAEHTDDNNSKGVKVITKEKLKEDLEENLSKLLVTGLVKGVAEKIDESHRTSTQNSQNSSREGETVDQLRLRVESKVQLVMSSIPIIKQKGKDPGFVGVELKKFEKLMKKGESVKSEQVLDQLIQKLDKNGYLEPTFS